jgi:hypothetical protein
MAIRRAQVFVASSVLMLMAAGLPAQSTPNLTDYFTAIPETVVDARYAPLNITPSVLGIHDLNGDGHQDLVVLGANLVSSACCVPQPSRVLLGDGNGRFTVAPASLFPVDTLNIVQASRVVFADFNADGQPDMFVGNGGYDADPFPGEQNRLYLSRAEGGWRDATDTLPQIADYTHTVAIGDISGRGFLDLFVGNIRSVSPYTLLNTGSGQFTQANSNIPVGPNQLLTFPGYGLRNATLADLNGDGLPELIVAEDANTAFKREHHSTILWNRAGVFVDSDKTELPGPGILDAIRSDYDVEAIDVDQDGLMDLVLVGTPTPSYSGWFVQVFINKGNRQFVDETAERVPPGDATGQFGGPKFWAQPYGVEVIDFNQDGAPDFFINFANGGKVVARDLPLVWLNDGTGHFSTLKVGDFVTPGNERLLGSSPRLMATRNGYSFVAPIANAGSLRITGLLAKKPYLTTGLR